MTRAMKIIGLIGGHELMFTHDNVLYHAWWGERGDQWLKIP